MNSIFIQNKEECLEKAGELLSQAFRKYEGQAVLFLTSGGSALDVLEYLDTRSLSGGVTLGVLDERFSLEMGVSNFEKFSSTDFFQVATVKGAHSFDLKIRQDDSKEVFATRFENALLSWREDNPEGKVIATLGMGQDGHTAGIFPYPEDESFFNLSFVDTLKWVTAYDAVGKNEYSNRVTVTIPFLKKEIDFGLVYIHGDDKKVALEKVLKPDSSICTIPASVFRDMKDVVVLSTIDLEK